MIPLGTDLRRVSSGTPKQYESALTTSLRRSLDQPSPWLAAAEQLGQFPTRRCVQMRPADWQELSGVMANITRLCHSSAPGRGQSCSHSSPSFASCLELLLKLGQVTSCLLCVNGDDRSFSIARVAQAIRTTTCVLQAAIAEAGPAGLSAEVADSLARQRCEQTPLLSAVTWALRQEARALYFNPRPTALSLGTALLDFFHEVEQLWPLGIFIPQQHELKLDATAAHMADPAAQLAMAMLRCAGRAMTEIGTGACRESLLCGLRTAYDMVQQISSLLDSPAVADTSAREALVKQLQQSPSLPQLMLALLAVETHRLHEQLGVSETDSCILLVPQQQQQQRRTTDGLDKQRSKRQSESSWSGRRGPESSQQLGQTNGAVQSRRCSTAGSTGSAGLAERQQSDQQHPPAAPLHQLRRTLSQQRLLQQQELQQQQQEEDEHAEIEGAGELHQVWHQVLGMARRNLARDQQDQPEQQPEGPRAPLKQLWVSLGLPEGLLQLAADAGVSAAPPVQQYLAVCRVGKFLLQGSPLLQPQHGCLYDHAGSPLGAVVASSPPTAAAGAGGGAGAVGGSVIRQHSLSAAGAAPLPPPAPAAAAAAGWQLSPFAYHAVRTPSRSWSGKGAGALPPPWQSASPAANSFLAASPGGIAAAGEALIGASSIGSLSPRDYPGTAGAMSVSAEAAEQLMESCRDYGLRGQEQLELLRLQRVVPVVLLNTAACLLQRQTNLTAAASPGNTSTTSSGSTSGSSSSSRVVPSEELQVVHAACTAAACVSRCWPVLQKVAAQQEELCDLLAECQPPSGVFAGLTTVCWKPYTLPEEVRLPVLPLLQLVVKLIWQLQPPWQQQQPPQQQQQQLGTSGCLPSVLQQRQDNNGGQGLQVLSPVSGECLDSLLEVLTAVSKLPWEQQTAAVAPARATAAATGTQDGAGSDSDDSEGSAAAVDAHLVAQAWQQECQPVAAAVEACLRTAGQVAAAGDGAFDFPPAGLASCRALASSSAAAAARAAGQGGSAGQIKVQRHPSAVALGSCLASLCAPFGRPGPLVAAAAAAAPGGPEQQQLFALLLSKLKVLLYNPASKKAGLIAMHPIEQTPVYIIQQLRTHSTVTVSSTQVTSAPVGAMPCSQQQLHTVQAAASKAMLPWLLLLSRLMVLRGKLLGHLLAHEADEAGKAGATSSLHTAYWHVKMAHESASTLAAQWKAAPAHPLTDGSGLKNVPQDQQQQQQVLVDADVQAELQLQLLPALKQAVQVLRAAMKLSRHYHETGFASGFAAGFAAGYAAAVAAASGLNGSSAAAAPGPVSFASPWAVLQQGCIRCLPQQLEAVGSKLAWQLRHLGCSNPLCVNLSLGSELWLVPDGSTEGRCSSSTGSGSAVTGSSNTSPLGAELSRGGDGTEGCQEVSHAADAPALCLSCSRAHVQAPKH